MIVYDVQHLVKVYPGQDQAANKDITLQIHEGEIFGLLGDNGAGKTTLVRQMVNLLRCTSGRITLFGELVDDKSFDCFVEDGPDAWRSRAEDIIKNHKP